MELRTDEQVWADRVLRTLTYGGRETTTEELVKAARAWKAFCQFPADRTPGEWRAEINAAVDQAQWAQQPARHGE